MFSIYRLLQKVPNRYYAIVRPRLTALKKNVAARDISFGTEINTYGDLTGMNEKMAWVLAVSFGANSSELPHIQSVQIQVCKKILGGCPTQVGYGRHEYDSP
jgi:hypothetical protein